MPTDPWVMTYEVLKVLFYIAGYIAFIKYIVKG